MLSIMLLLRKVWGTKKEKVPLHVVGENSEDMTEKLALGPNNVTISDESNDPIYPDFINSQAIYARVLVQTAAYPHIHAAITDLFSPGHGTANLEFAHASNFVTLNEPLCFATIRAAVKKKPGERSICIGVVDEHGFVELLPYFRKEFTPTSRHKLVLIRRFEETQSQSQNSNSNSNSNGNSNASGVGTGHTDLRDVNLTTDLESDATRQGQGQGQGGSRGDHTPASPTTSSMNTKGTPLADKKFHHAKADARLGR